MMDMNLKGVQRVGGTEEDKMTADGPLWTPDERRQIQNDGSFCSLLNFI